MTGCTSIAGTSGVTTARGVIPSDWAVVPAQVPLKGDHLSGTSAVVGGGVLVVPIVFLSEVLPVPPAVVPPGARLLGKMQKAVVLVLGLVVPLLYYFAT